MNTPSSRQLRTICMALSALIALGASGCKSVLFAERIKTPPTGTEDAPVVRIFVDRNGDLYPSAEVPLKNSDVRDGIQYYFTSNKFRQRCTGTTTGSQAGLQAFCKYNSTSGASKDATWLALQSALWAAHAREVAALASPPGGAWRPVVVFLHGYRNEIRKVDRSYQALREKVVQSRGLAGRTPVIVEVFWDGRHTPFVFGVYRPAQPTASVVGFNLRQLINGLTDHIDAEIPVRVLGHSSGGIIAAALVGNTTHIFPDIYPASCVKRGQSINFRRYCENPAGNDTASPVRIPQLKDFRIGLLAAATPAQSFTGTSKLNSGAPEGVQTDTLGLVLSSNPRDRVLGMSCGLGGLGGNSCLGRSTQHAEEVQAYFKARSREKGADLNVTIIDFPGQGAHSFTNYLDNPSFEGFLETSLDLAGETRSTGSTAAE